MKSTKNTFINFIVLSIVAVLIGTALTYYPKTHAPALVHPGSAAPLPAANSAKALPETLPVNRP